VTQEFNITVTNVNDPPVITSEPIITAREDSPYIYDVIAEDLDPTNDILTYSLFSSPAGMEIDPDTGIITWIPINNQIGLNSVFFKVSDGNGGEAKQLFTIAVSNTNDAPQIISNPKTEAVEDKLFTYNILAIDGDSGDVLSYYLDSGPSGMVINQNTGKLTWRPTNDQVGMNSIKILVLDSKGATALQSFTIDVINKNDAPKINSKPSTLIALGGNFEYYVVVQDIDQPGDELTFSLLTSPTGMELDPATGVLTWRPGKDQLGSHNVEVQVADGNNGTDSQLFAVKVYETDDTEPTAEEKPDSQDGLMYGMIGIIILLVLILIIILFMFFRKEKSIVDTDKHEKQSQ
jgi:hypothetical protein